MIVSGRAGYVIQHKDVAATKAFRWCVFPSLRRRGGSATKKMPRSLRSGRDGVVAHTPCFKTHFETFRCERPPRRFAPPLLCKEGNGTTKEIAGLSQEWRGRRFPSLHRRKEGWLRHLENVAEPPK